LFSADRSFISWLLLTDLPVLTRGIAMSTPPSTASALPPIQHIVVLMLENRSFDHVFGTWPGVSGLTQGPFSNRPNPTAAAGPGNTPIAAGQPALFSVAQGQGPSHSLDGTNDQLFTSTVVKSGAALAPVNDRGFVENYKSALAADGFGAATADLTTVMQSFVAGQLPGLTALAQNFVLCDQWYAEVPGPTMPNRLYMHAATSAGWARNDWSQALDSVTIYEQVQTSGRTWAVYYSDQNEVAQYSRINTQRANFKLYEAGFAADAAAGKLANYNFIIPRFAASAQDGPVTSMHAPKDVRPGDQLVADVYAALRSSPQWPQTLFIVTFDEHGGYFDHADPAAAVNPDGIDSPAPGDTASFAPQFAFDRMGLRVPTILASPYLAKGVVCSTPLQHTSILATARKFFGISSALTRRDAAATSFENLFLAAPRTDTPTVLISQAAAPQIAFDATNAAPDDVMSEMALDWRKATAALPGAPAQVAAPATQDEIHRFIRSQVQTFLDYRAATSAGNSLHQGKQMATQVTVQGSKRTLLPNSRSAGPVDPKEIISLTVRTRSVGDLAALEQRVKQQSSQPLATRTYLTRAQLAAGHGAKVEDLDLVEQLAHQHNLMVVHRSAAERSIVLKGSLGDLLGLFPANLQMYHHSSGTYRGRQGEIQMPKALEGIVTGVFGFDSRPKHRHRRLPHAGPGGSNGVASTEFAKRYNFPTAYQGVNLDGTGQTIAIIELGGGFRTSDLKVFFNEIGVAPPTVTAISVDHSGSKPTTPDSADGEVMLDIEVAGAVAPKAKFAVYFAPNNGDQGFIDGITAAVHDSERNPGVISISWGGPENTTDQQGITAFHELFVAAAAVGMTVCVASGDHGTADSDADDWDGKIHVDHPAVDDMVLGCGGTQIDSNGNDVVWNDGTPFDKTVPGGGGWASGGGISEVIAVPSYQANANLPVSIDSGKSGRGVPDIAMSATNYYTRVDSAEGASGGTSAVAPLMSALVALLNQAKQKNVGFLNPTLYANAGAGVVHDVTSGTNAITNTIKGYSAGPGWDACSGLGTPDGTALLGKL
jgi:kumamolisin